jgi:CHAT domain-containing protein/tetratricopeptide (TPR) repeat protein
MKTRRASSNASIGAIAVSVMLTVACVLAGECATPEEQQFDVDILSGNEASFEPDTARKALPGYLRMAAELEQRGHYRDASIAYSNARQSAQVLGRLQDALNAAEKAVQMAERADDAVQLGIALNRLGHTLVALNEFHKAIPVFERAAALDVAIQHPAGKAGSYRGLSKIYRKLRDLDRAAANAVRAVAVMEAAIQKQSVRTGKRGQRESGAPRDSKRLRGRENTYAHVLIEAGTLQLALGQWEPARASFQKALEVGSRLDVPGRMAHAHIGLGKLAVKQREWPAAATHLEKAIQLDAGPGPTATAQNWLGRAYRGMGKLPQAEQVLRDAVAGFEDLRALLQSEELRESYFEDKVTPYELLILTLVDQGKGADAFDFSERARARAFLDLLGNRVTLSAGRAQALVAEEQALRARISALKAKPEDEDEDSAAAVRELGLAREAYQAFLARVRAQDREQASLMTVEPLTLAQVQALLPEGAVLLEYFVTGQGETLLWSVERQELAVARLPLGRGGVAKRVQAFRESIASRGQTADTQRLAQELFAQLVRPGLRGGLPRELLIVPHDVLHYLPFQALMPAPGRYLIQDVPVSYYSSASLMQFTRAKAQGASSTLLALGNPDLHDPALNLRYAEREVREIAELFLDTHLLTGKDATKAESRAEGPKHRLLHFATHAELDEADPLGSALRLTPSGGDDGRLEVQEIFGLTLRADLVVLSACETGLGTLRQGDEITGFTRAFIYAGTPSIITTLWQVNDRASYELMRAFYQGLKAGQPKAEALRQAQLATLQRYPHPYYWAAYQLTGEAR